jgi:hypothetical protein
MNNLEPQEKDFGGVVMVNIDWVMDKFEILHAAGVSRKMRQLNIRAVKIGRQNFYALPNIQKALLKGLRREQ